MGPKIVNDITLLGTMLPAKEALRLGIVNQVVPLDQLGAAVMKMTNSLLVKSPYGLARMKWLNYQQAELTVNAALDEGTDKVTMWLQYPDVQEGLHAFLEKRKADYSQFKGKIKPTF